MPDIIRLRRGGGAGRCWEYRLQTKIFSPFTHYTLNSYNTQNCFPFGLLTCPGSGEDVVIFQKYIEESTFASHIYSAQVSDNLVDLPAIAGPAAGSISLYVSYKYKLFQAK